MKIDLNWTTVVSGVMVIVSMAVAYKACSDRVIQDKINKQNELAFKDSLKIVTDGKQELYHQYITVVKDDSIKNVLLNKRAEKILSLLRENIQLNAIVSNSEGTVIDTVKENCYGMRLLFTNDGPFYSYTDTVFVEEIPWHKLKVNFKQFAITSYITRNKEGIWSTYIEVPDNIKKYVKIASIETTVDPKLYGLVEKPSPPSLSVIPMFTPFILDSKAYVSMSLVAVVKNKYSFLVSKGIKNNFIQVGLGWNFDIIQ